MTRKRWDSFRIADCGFRNPDSRAGVGMQLRSSGMFVAPGGAKRNLGSANQRIQPRRGGNTVTKSFFLFTCFLIFASSCWAQDCIALRDYETTRAGFSATVVRSERKPRKEIRGRVVLGDRDTPQVNVFVEVFPLDPKLKARPRVAGCRTGQTGEFEFTDLAKGKYKIRLSKDGGFMITEIRVKVDPATKNSERISASIELGY
jgi:hypothetical protein